MKYIEYTFTTQPSNGIVHDVLSGVLAEIGFDSFVQSEDGSEPLKAYIKKDADSIEAVQQVIAEFPLPDTEISFTHAEAEDRDWNEVWEQNYFQPLVIGNRCVIASTFHKDVPDAEYHITIDPRMAFGTGHHATTSQMIGQILDNNMEGLDVLDMGCGTGILAILARMRGAKHCVAIDNDEWCVSNTLENISLNDVNNIDVVEGDASALEKYGHFHVVIANINRNILLADMHHYVDHMTSGSLLFMSGFYTEDVPAIRQEAERLGLVFIECRDQDNWACVKFEKR
ncbi:MAG: 50S ribosomal protein L11 methyltransferase [Bacteroidaceae bacterium]|nr:50S ribosomal protein L11 methyltransferase [Bacteroidaceae bacterium]